jgi:hypothetical protein
MLIVQGPYGGLLYPYGYWDIVDRGGFGASNICQTNKIRKGTVNMAAVTIFTPNENSFGWNIRYIDARDIRARKPPTKNNKNPVTNFLI